MHADHAAQLGLVGSLAIRDSRGVVGAVQRRADVVGHAAVHGHVHAFRHRIAALVFGFTVQLHRLDGAHAVQRDAGGGHRPAAWLEGDDRGRHAERAVHGADRVGEPAELHVDVHGILTVGVGHGIATAQIDLRQGVRIGGVEGLAQQHHALGRLDESVRVMDVGSDVRVHADQFEHVLMVVDVLQHGERRTVGHHGHGFGELAVAFGDLLVAQVVRVFDVVLELAFRVGGVVGAVGGRRVLPQSCVRPCRRHVGQVVEHSKLARVGSGGEQGHAELLVLVRGGHEFVAAGVDAGGDAQHDAGALAEPLGDRGDACRLIRLVNHDFVEALFDGQLDFRIGLVVAVQHEPAAGDTRGERDAHLAHGAGVDEHAGFGDDSADFLA